MMGWGTKRLGGWCQVPFPVPEQGVTHVERRWRPGQSACPHGPLPEPLPHAGPGEALLSWPPHFPVKVLGTERVVTVNPMHLPGKASSLSLGLQ